LCGRPSRAYPATAASPPACLMESLLGFHPITSRPRPICSVRSFWKRRLRLGGNELVTPLPNTLQPDPVGRDIEGIPAIVSQLQVKQMHGAMPHGAMPHGAMPHGAMPHGAMPHGAMPHGAMAPGYRLPSQLARAIFSRGMCDSKLSHLLLSLRFLPKTLLVFCSPLPIETCYLPAISRAPCRKTGTAQTPSTASPHGP
jgi:hypothetical protein